MGTNNQKVFTILLASGRGKRLNTSIPKQFICINKIPIFFYSLITFLKIKKIEKIILVVNFKFKSKVEEIVNKLQWNKNVKVILGGNSRNESLMKGLSFLKNNFNVQSNDIVLTHDSARPLVSKKIIEENIFKLLKNDCEVTSTGLYCSDTVALVENENRITRILDRKKIFLEQTPQGAKFKVFDEIFFNQKNINELLNKSNDFCEIALFFKKKIALVNGDVLNFKITNIQDLLLLKKILKSKN